MDKAWDAVADCTGLSSKYISNIINLTFKLLLK